MDYSLNSLIAVDERYVLILKNHEMIASTSLDFSVIGYPMKHDLLVKRLYKVLFSLRKKSHFFEKQWVGPRRFSNESPKNSKAI